MSIGFNRYEIHTQDASGETSVIDWLVSDLTPTAMLALYNAISAVSLNSFGPSVLVDRTLHQTTLLTPATDLFARNELAWLVRVRDVTTLYTERLYIPGADLTLLATNSDLIDTGSQAYADLVAAIEAKVISGAGNAVEVVSIEVADR